MAKKEIGPKEKALRAQREARAAEVERRTAEAAKRQSLTKRPEASESASATVKKKKAPEPAQPTAVEALDARRKAVADE